MNLRVFFTKSTADQTQKCFVDKIEFCAVDFFGEKCYHKTVAMMGYRVVANT